MITKLTPLSLYSVRVPKDAFDYFLYINDKSTHIVYTILGKLGIVSLFDGNWELLGEVTKSSISFDLEDYVENLFTDEAWKDYRILENKGWESYPLLTPEKSFYSLLAVNVNGIYFENPMQPPIQMDYVGFEDYPAKYPVECYEHDIKEWQSYESNLIDKVVILKQENNGKK